MAAFCNRRKAYLNPLALEDLFDELCKQYDQPKFDYGDEDYWTIQLQTKLASQTCLISEHLCLSLCIMIKVLLNSIALSKNLIYPKISI